MEEKIVTRYHQHMETEEVHRAQVRLDQRLNRLPEVNNGERFDTFKAPPIML